MPCLFVQVGSTEETAIRMLDFSASPRAGCWVDSADGSVGAGTSDRDVDSPKRSLEAEAEAEAAAGRSPGVEAKLSRWPVAVAAHPHTNELVVGTVGGGLHGIGPWHMGSL
jgi:hypothetical protein